MSDRYILDARGQPEPCDDLFAWAHWYETADRRVALTEIADPDHADTPIEVSTVFLAVDHRSVADTRSGPAILWETLIFCDPQRENWLRDRLREYDGLWGVMDRYSSVEDARAGHERMVHAVRAAMLLASME